MAARSVSRSARLSGTSELSAKRGGEGSAGAPQEPELRFLSSGRGAQKMPLLPNQA